MSSGIKRQDGRMQQGDKADCGITQRVQLNVQLALFAHGSVLTRKKTHTTSIQNV
jgi:hypothetical protein